MSGDMLYKGTQLLSKSPKPNSATKHLRQPAPVATPALHSLTLLVCLQFEFSYYFETGTRRRCYLAPERFYDAGQASPHPDALQPAMVSPPSSTRVPLPSVITSCSVVSASSRKAL